MIKILTYLILIVIIFFLILENNYLKESNEFLKERINKCNISKYELKKAKMFRKHLRKEIKGGLNMLSKIVRPRPKYIQKFIWIWFYLPLFRIKDLKIIYREIK